MSRRATAPAGPPSAASDDVPEEAAEAPAYPVLREPAEGVPPVIESERDLVTAARRLAEGGGPVALDAERASGYRYSGRAYLVQLRRAGAGSFLIDPIACPDLEPIQDVIADVEWVLHAATQDLPCLADLGLRPSLLFDTELGGRLAGLPRVGLSAVVEHYLGLTLAKEHSAADWSTRPLPEPWLRYAALDVEVLVEVRDQMAQDLQQQGKQELAAQEFDALTRFTGPPVRGEPWRRTSGMHALRNRRQLARVRALWETRDDIARQRDLAPGRVLPDKLLVQVAAAGPRTDAELQAVAPAGSSSSRGRPRPANRSLARYRAELLAAVRTADALSDRQLPPATVRSDSPPPARAWADRDPLAAARLAQVRDGLATRSQELSIPVENLLTPDTLRRVLWTPPSSLDAAGLAAALSELGGRPWQVDVVLPLLLEALREHPDTDE